MAKPKKMCFKRRTQTKFKSMFGVREKNTYQKKVYVLKKLKFKLTKNIKTDKKHLQVSLGLIILIIFFLLSMTIA